jgi:hypothetical protein
MVRTACCVPSDAHQLDDWLKLPGASQANPIDETAGSYSLPILQRDMFVGLGVRLTTGCFHP